MKITDLAVDGFGVWKGLSVDDLSERLTVFFGENETGKTTLLQFVRSVLYGFSPERRGRYLPPVRGGRPGGSLGIASPSGRFRIQRFADQRDPVEGQLEVIAADGTIQGRHQLASLLADVDEATFNNVFAIGLREIQQLGTLTDTEAARQLYDLTGGLDRVSLPEVVRELQTSRTRILDAGEGPCQVAHLLSEHERLEEEIGQLRAAGQEWSRLAVQADAAGREIARLEEGVASLERQAKVIEIARSVREKWDRRVRVRQQLRALGPLPDLPGGSLDTLERLGQRIAKHRQWCQKLKRERVKLREQAVGLTVNEPIWRQAARIEALSEQQPWIASMKDQVERLEEETLLLQEELATQRQQLGLAGDEPAVAALPEVSDRTLAALRGPARAVRQQKRQWVQARRDFEVSGKDAKRLDGEIQAGLTVRGEKELTDALQRAGQLVLQLRRRIHLDERLEQLARHRAELEEQGQYLVQRQVLPIWTLVALGGVFVLGIVMILTGLLGGLLTGSGTVGWLLPLLGLGGIGASVAAKFALERSASRRLNECRKQSELLELQVEKTEQERDELDRQLPRGGGPLVRRLATAEAELASTEAILPLDAQRNAARQEAEAAKRRAAKARESLKTALRRWRGALRSIGLPSTLSPKQIRELTGSCETVRQLQRRLSARGEELQQRKREWSTLTDRISRLFSEVALTSESPDPITQLKQLRSELGHQEQLARRRDGLRRQARSLRRTYKKHARAAKGLLRRQRGLFDRVGVSGEEEFRQLARQHAQARELRENQDELTAEIAAAIGSTCTEEELARQIDGKSDGPLDQRLEELLSEFDAAEDKLKGLYERRGRLAEQMNVLAADRRISEAQLEKGCIEQRLTEAVRQWQVLAVTSLLLEEVHKVYETQRQPETLKEASGYLKRLTKGRYHRVWTPLGEDILKVDDADGKPLSLDVLSRGTREQVFLSLRMSLAAAYARRGTPLPLVLDDVLVNFDAGRAKAAAQVLRDFAKAGHQLLVFTCHEHIKKLFTALKVPVRQLDDNAKQPHPDAADEKPKKRRRRSKKAEKEPVEEPLKELIEEPVEELEELVEELMEKPVEQLIEEPVEELIEEPVEELVAESVEELVEEHADKEEDLPGATDDEVELEIEEFLEDEEGLEEEESDDIQLDEEEPDDDSQWEEMELGDESYESDDELDEEGDEEVDEGDEESVPWDEVDQWDERPQGDAEAA